MPTCVLYIVHQLTTGTLVFLDVTKALVGVATLDDGSDRGVHVSPPRKPKLRKVTHELYTVFVIVYLNAIQKIVARATLC